MTHLHVAITGSDAADGTAEHPLRTINRAAQVATPGDTVTVHAGEYREWVKPLRGGLNASLPIVYEAAEGEHVAIKGSERITTWEREDGPVWRVRLPNAMFGDWNPYERVVEGDWVVRAGRFDAPSHLGDVYVNGRSFYEVPGRADVAAPSGSTTVTDDRTGQTVPVADPDATQNVWCAQVDETTTTIWANFHDSDPNTELTEINVRRSVFFPERTHVDHIVVRGFELAHAATPWAPPTADQPGLIGPNWAKGWVIEHNHIHDAKCSAVSLGKEQSTGDNNFTRRHDKPGYQYQLESVFAARARGWSKEHVGSHLVRDNVIHDCGQNGIVGHLGCAFSSIRDNTIYRVADKREFYGHEIGGIKLHAAIDVQIVHNHIHDSALGIWLDWQTQGTRVSRNVMHDNCRDIYVEVSHGPYVVDHNVFASPVSVESMSDGGAYINNLIAGTFLVEPVMNRATPYHRAHSTEVAGYAVIYGGDDRIVGNLFVGTGIDTAAGVRAAYPAGFGGAATVGYGALVYDGHPSSFQEYLNAVDAELPGDLDVFLRLKNPVYVWGNAYTNGARPYVHEAGACTGDAATGEDRRPRVTVSPKTGQVWLSLTLDAATAAHRLTTVTTAALERVRMVGEPFDDPHGCELVFDTDLLGDRVDGTTPAGPIHSLTAGDNDIRIW